MPREDEEGIRPGIFLYSRPAGVWGYSRDFFGLKGMMKAFYGCWNPAAFYSQFQAPLPESLGV